MFFKALSSYFNQFFNIFFPKTCIACENNLIKFEKILCTECFHDLPKTEFHISKDNKVARLFWGVIQIEDATGFFFFSKGSKYQKLLHKLKYKNAPFIGVEMGKIMAGELSNTEYALYDVLIPIPLHKDKLKKRGYNQSERIAFGISEILNIKLDDTSLIRNKYTQTQTNKSVEQRKENVNSVFSVIDADLLKNKKILIVDDVLTTGATIASCAETILKIPGTKVGVITLAVA